MKDEHAMGIRIPIPLYQQIRRLAYEENRTFGAMLRILCAEALTRRKLSRAGRISEARPQQR